MAFYIGFRICFEEKGQWTNLDKERQLDDSMDYIKCYVVMTFWLSNIFENINI